MSFFLMFENQILLSDIARMVTDSLLNINHWLFMERQLLIVRVVDVLCVLCSYVLECSNCGVIYRSRQHWYGNAEPEKTVVRTEIRHVWPDVIHSEISNDFSVLTECLKLYFFIISDFIIERHNWREIWLSYFYGVIVYNRSVKSFFALHSVDAKGNTVLHGSHNAARRFLDGINYVSESIVGVSAKPTKFVSSWVTDKIAPSYWIPNAQIKVLCCICWLTNHHGLCWLNSSMNRPSDD